MQAARPGVLPGTRVGGIDIGGLGEAELLSRVQVLAQQRQQRPLDATRDDEAVSSTAGELGYVLDAPATVHTVLRRGRQANPIAALRDHLVATVTTTRVAPVESFDDGAFQDWVDRIGTALGLQTIEGDVRIEGTEVDVVVPEAGETIDVEALRVSALAALDDPAAVAIEVPTRLTTPAATPDELAALAEQARHAISDPVTLLRATVTLTFPPELIGQLLEVHAQPVSGEAGEADLVLAIDAVGVSASITAQQFAALQAEPRDAVFVVGGGGVDVVPARDGFAFDARLTAAQLLAVATGPGPRTAPLEGRITRPALRTDDALALGITEEVSVFTTDHPCCQGRVTNIQRIAELVRGTVVQPGGRFSLNALVGPRTTANGFVDGGAISAGEFVEEIGGGVSQFTTTLFNAIFLGGYQIEEFKPHSYYIDRYPLGREATLNFDPPIDLAFTNDSPNAIYIHTATTDTSITVSLYATRWAHVETTTGERYGFREPEEQREDSDELPLGEERVVQSGRQGFSVDFTRELAYVDGRAVTEEYTTNYLPEPRIIEVGTRGEEASPEPSEEVQPPPDVDDPPDDEPVEPDEEPVPDEPDPEPSEVPATDPVPTPPPATTVPEPPAPTAAPTLDPGEAG